MFASFCLYGESERKKRRCCATMANQNISTRPLRLQRKQRIHFTIDSFSFLSLSLEVSIEPKPFVHRFGSECADILDTMYLRGCARSRGRLSRSTVSREQGTRPPSTYCPRIHLALLDLSSGEGSSVVTGAISPAPSVRDPRPA